MTANHFNEIEFHIIELKKFRKSAIIEPSKKEFWLWFIDHTNKEMVDLGQISNEEIEKAEEELRKIYSNEELMQIIEQRKEAKLEYYSAVGRDKRKAMAEGMAKGMAKGKLQEKVETAKKMLNLNIDLKTIAEVTSLSEEEIKKLN